MSYSYPLSTKSFDPFLDFPIKIILKKQNIEHLFATLKDRDWEEKEKNILSLREEFEKR